MTKTKERQYYAKVAIVGQSGSGKSYMTKTADRKTTGYINFERKPLPYKAEPFKFEGRPSAWAGFRKNLQDYIKNPEVKAIIVDSFTMALNTLIKEMSSRYSGFDIYKFYNKEVYEFLERKVIFNTNESQLFHDSIKQKDNTDMIVEQMKLVKEKHTYISRIQDLLSVLKL
jgi:ABC-type oligopeptide transport system ATPase subunit